MNIKLNRACTNAAGVKIHRTFPSASRLPDTTMPSIEQARGWVSQQVSESSTADSRFGKSPTADDSESITDAPYEQGMGIIRDISKQIHRRSCKRPRQIEGVQIGKDILLSHANRPEAKPQPSMRVTDTRLMTSLPGSSWSNLVHNQRNHFSELEVKRTRAIYMVRTFRTPTSEHFGIWRLCLISSPEHASLMLADLGVWTFQISMGE